MLGSIQTHVLESGIVSHCVIYKSKLNWMRFHTITSRQIFAIWYKNHSKYETKTSTWREHQLWRSLRVEVFISFLQWFLYQTTKTRHGVKEGRHIQLCLNLYITQWDKIQDSKTCVWTQLSKIRSVIYYATPDWYTFLSNTSKQGLERSQRSATQIIITPDTDRKSVV